MRDKEAHKVGLESASTFLSFGVQFPMVFRVVGFGPLHFLELMLCWLYLFFDNRNSSELPITGLKSWIGFLKYQLGWLYHLCNSDINIILQPYEYFIKVIVNCRSQFIFIQVKTDILRECSVHMVLIHLFCLTNYWLFWTVCTMKGYFHIYVTMYMKPCKGFVDFFLVKF